MKFAHLTVSSEYSVNYSICRVKEIVAAAVADAMPAVAITDHNNLYGAFKFFNIAIKAGIKPIIAAKIDMGVNDIVFPIYLYCKDVVGYRLLNKLIFETKKRPINISELSKYDISGLILILDPSEELLQAKPNLENLFNEFINNAYIGLSRIKPAVEDYVWLLSREYKLPVVAIMPVCFMAPEDFTAHEVRVCINKGELFKSGKSGYSKDQFFHKTADIIKRFNDQTIALDNTMAIVQRCNFGFDQGLHLPLFPVAEGQNLDQYFAEQSQLGLSKRFKINIHDSGRRDEYILRLATEIKIIQDMKFSGYFLIVADFIQWAREHGIPVGPGRGSGAGSLVAYALGITDIDPIEYGLLFERFLNPERVSMPDFDIDFCMDGRDKVIGYVAKKYGDDHVSQIITFGTLAAKAVVRDVGRVLGHPYGFMDALAKLIPMDLGMTLAKALDEEPMLRERYLRESEVKKIFDLAQKLEGLVRQVGRHAGGVVIAPQPLLNFMPVDTDPDQGSVSQFDKDDLESIGLVKFDFLGLRTLTIIDWTLQSIAKSGLEQIALHKIPLDDAQVFQMLQFGKSTAVFQLESRGMKELIKRLKPDCFEDIVSLVALFRPGPLQSGMVDDFIDRKHGLADIIFLHPKLESILAPTYGVILYQEQVMQIAQVLSNYTLGGADLLRRAMGKKKPEEMAKQRDIFVAGALANNVSAELSGSIFDVIEKFAGYGFNRSHSVAYALLSYHTSWLKFHYPSHFMASVMTSDLDNTDKIITLLQECKQMGIKVNLPNIEESDFGFTAISSSEIKYGLGSIKGVGESAVEAILRYRAKHGRLGNLSNLIACLSQEGKLNKKLLESLCYSGALDVWQVDREDIYKSLEYAIKHANQQQTMLSVGQGDLFGKVASEFKYQTSDKWSLLQKLQYEKSVLGYYVSGHPMDSMQKEMYELGFKGNSHLGIGRKRKMAGMVSGVRLMQSKTGRSMLFFILSDGSIELDVAVFGQQVAEVRELLQTSNMVMVEGDIAVDERNGGLKVQAASVVTLDDYRFARAKVLYVDIDHSKAPSDYIEILQEKFHMFPRGAVRIILNYDGESVLAGADYRLQLQSYFVDSLIELAWVNIRLGYEIPYECRSYA